jgi:hypothetical protein
MKASLRYQRVATRVFPDIPFLHSRYREREMKEMTCYAGPMVLPAMQVLLCRYSHLLCRYREREMNDMKEMKGPMVLSCI